MGKWYRSDPCKEFSIGMMRFGERLIQNIAIVSAGEARGHGVVLDRNFLRDVVRLGNAKRNGVKARFGHPSMSSDALGTFVGRCKRFRLEGETVRGDLELSKIADESPHGKLAEYIMRLADNDPDMFGMSIVFSPTPEFKMNDAGDMVTIDDPEFQEIVGDTLVGIEGLHACDVVDDPASNDGLFSQWSAEMPAARVTQFLDENPDVFKLLKNYPEIQDQFVRRYELYLETKTKKEKVNMEKNVNDLKTKDDEIIENQIELELESDAGNDDHLVTASSANRDDENDHVRMINDFGSEFATRAIKEGLSYHQAQCEYISLLRAENVGLHEDVERLSTEIASLSEKMDSLNRAYSEGEDAVSADAVDDDDKGDSLNRYAGKTNENIGRFAAGLAERFGQK